MNWSKLLPSNPNPEAILRHLFAANHAIATQALRDMVIFLTFSIAAILRGLCFVANMCFMAQNQTIS